MRLLKATAIWFLILVFAFANGALRELFLLPTFGTPVAPVASGLLLSICIATIAFIFVPRLGTLAMRESLAIGALWLCLTLAFEFGFGRFIQQRSWPELLEAYTFKDGNIWPLVLLVTVLAPFVVTRVRAGVKAHDE